MSANISLDSALRSIFRQMLESLDKNLIKRWYPLVVDKANGGYYTDVSFDFKLEKVQHKMAVTQGRHMWTSVRAAEYFDSKVYVDAAIHGFDFFKKKMWDQKYGGFYQMRDERGETCDYLGFYDEKRTYGNAFMIYGLAALCELTGDPNVLELAKEAFYWIEEHAYDPKGGGYFQFLTREGKPFGKNEEYKTKADDAIEAGYKDQNSSIHLLEAYTELYKVWHDETLRERLSGLLTLIRDVITTPEGYMNLFFDYDWKPISFKYATKEVREKNYRLDHVSFGHNYETGFLMLEASYALGLTDDVKTLTVAKQMLDHAIENGWEKENGGFVDAAYYFAGDERCTIIQDTKNWWAQAEALNVLLMMSQIFPRNDVYIDYFVKEWDYVDKFLLDHEHGDWYEGGLDKQPYLKMGPKGHIWKGAYHTGRALMNCTEMLSRNFPEIAPTNEGFVKAAEHLNKLINHWKTVAAKFLKT
jgi:mannobiose 2-epimerase